MTRTLSKNPHSPNLKALPTTPPLKAGYLGYTVQQYVAKRTGGDLRPTQAYDKYKKMIPERAAELREFSASSVSDFALGVVPNMFSMIPLAQSAHAPIMALESRDGIRGAQNYQRDRYATDLRSIFANIAKNAGL